MSPVGIVPIVPVVHSSADTHDHPVKLVTESSTGRIVEIDAVRGAALVDLRDAYTAPVPFHCRVATAACRIQVLEGTEQ